MTKTIERIELEKEMIPARDVMARGIGWCVWEEKPLERDIEDANRAMTALLDAGYRIVKL